MKSQASDISGGFVRTVTLSPPRPGDNTADAERLARALSEGFGGRDVTVDFPVLPGLSATLRESGFRARAVLFPRGRGLSVIAVEAPGHPAPVLGLAVDLGTTRVVLRLIDMESGRVLGESAGDNPQVAAGPDVLARVHFAESGEGLAELKSAIAGFIGGEAEKLAKAAGCGAERILCAAVAGNTVMSHLFLGLPPRTLIREPYIPVTNRPGAIPAADLGLGFAPGALVFVFPNVGSYFGGDLVSGILAVGLDRAQKPLMMADVGTNAEVVVGCADWMVGCAGAAGPALEGGVSRMGTVAVAGAIERVDLDPDSGGMTYSTIGGLAPVGICGSGVIDLAACLFLSGRMDIRGKLVKERCGERMVTREGLPAFLLAPASESGAGRDLCFTQADLDSLTRSKAAMYTILSTLIRTVGLEFEDLDAFYVAGAFGSFIRPESAVAIGMIPDLPLSSYRAAGNTSLAGAELVLKSPADLFRVDEVAAKITYIELNVNQEFMNRFSAAKFYPHTDIARFPTVAALLAQRKA